VSSSSVHCRDECGDHERLSSTDHRYTFTDKIVENTFDFSFLVSYCLVFLARGGMPIQKCKWILLVYGIIAP